ncbi:hypothetical protein ABEW79_20655 [Delftia tsuruhatensis]|uniref:hypothetical protein n=2 Tax=Delftia tsuruhatensis TaxID=180282 RepID=UPI003D1D01BE
MNTTSNNIAGAAPAAVAPQDVVAWMHPETLDVIHADRKHEWATRYGIGGHSMAEGYTVALVRAGEPAAASPALEAPSAYNSAGPIKRYMLDCNIDGMDQFREFILATDHDTLVHDVLANADPAGTVQENGLLRDQVRQLDAMVGRMKREAVAPQAPAAPVLVGDGQADAYLADPGRLETLARSHPAGLVRALARAALAAAPQAPAALEELRKIAAIAACWGCDHPDAPGDTETVRRIKWAARQLRAAAQAPAAPAVDAFTHAELLEIKRAVEEFADCNETDVDYALLLRAAQAGYLECTQFHVLNQSALDLDTVAAAQAKEGGA